MNWTILLAMYRRFKHCVLIDDIPKCPDSEGAEAQARPAYHFVVQPLADQRNFRPAKIKQPMRAFRPDQVCRACALSMYDTEDAARAMFAYLKSAHKKLDVGTHIASARMESTDGASTSSDQHGHYAFFEYVDSNITFDMVGVL